MPSKTDNANFANDLELAKPITSEQRSQRLTIKHLMFWLFGVAVALTCAQELNRNHYAAYAAVDRASGIEPNAFVPMGITGTVVAIGFGTGFSLAILAVMDGAGFWRAPARVGIMVLGAIGVISFLVELSTTSYVARTGQAYVWQANYFGFCQFLTHLLGFVLVCFLTPWLKVRWNWAFAWWSLVLFALFGLVIYSFHFPFVRRLAPRFDVLLFSHWQLAKLIQTGISVTGLAVAISVDLWKRNSVSWLAVVTAIGMIIGQVALHVRDISSLIELKIDWF